MVGCANGPHFVSRSKIPSMTECVVLPVNAIRLNSDSDWAFHPFAEKWAFGFLFSMTGIGVNQLHLSFTQDLEAVVKIGARCKRLRSKAGAWVINFQQFDRVRG